MMAKYRLLSLILLGIFSINCLALSALAKAKNKSSLKIITKSDAALPYSKEIDKLTKQMQQIARVYQTASKTDYWAAEGKKSILKLLHSKGYYGASVEYEISDDKTNQIIFYLYPAEPYKFSKIEILVTGRSKDEIILPALSDIGIKPGQNAVAEKVLKAEELLFDFVEEHNCLLSLSTSHQAIVDHGQNTVDITIPINAGETAYVKSINLEELESVDPEYVKKIIAIKNGTCFKQKIINQAKTKLQKSGLFASITPVIPKHTDKDGGADIIFKLKERKHRSLTAGLAISTDLGFGVTLGWDHRNFNSHGEKLSSKIFANQKEQQLETTYSIPFFGQDNQTLNIGAELKNVKTKVFDSHQGAIFTNIERYLSEIYTIGIGTKYSLGRITENRQKKEASLLSFSPFAARDTRDNILDPHEGSFIKAEVSPFIDLKSPDTTSTFFKNTITASSYFTAEAIKDLVVATRAKLGSMITKSKLQAIPATERFYAGGFNSIRGYGYQLAGKLNKDKKATGGNSLLEANLELRKRLKNDFGVAIFFDAGSTYNTSRPKFNESLFYSVGIGIRYYTNFGPLRADIAMPINKRKIDKGFQFYFGIGQTF